MSNHIHVKQRDVITYPGPNFNGGLIELPTSLRYFTCLFTSHPLNNELSRIEFTYTIIFKTSPASLVGSFVDYMNV